MVDYIQLLPSNLEGRESNSDINATSNWVPLEYVSIDANLWGLSKYRGRSDLIKGYSSIKVVSGSLLLKTDMEISNVDLQEFNVVAYPEIIFGYKPWGISPTHPVLDKPIKFPIKVADLPRIILHTDYTLINTTTSINISYDLWLLNENKIRPVKQGDYEIMIWLYRYRNLQEQQLNPAGNKIGVLTVPILLNGDIVNANWEVWYLEKMSEIGWSYIALALENPIPKGAISLDLYEMLKKLIQTLNLNLADFYLTGIEFGSEIFYNNKVNVEWRLDKYLIFKDRVDKKTEEALLKSK